MDTVRTGEIGCGLGYTHHKKAEKVKSFSAFLYR